MIKAIINVQNFASGLRAASMLMKFILIFYLASQLNISDFGVFNLMMAGVQLVSALVPLDVYSVSIRKLLEQEENILGYHFGFLLASTIILVPLSAFAFYYSSNNITIYISMVFLFLCPFEVFFIEFTRLFPALNQPFLPSFLMFLKNTLFSIPVIIFFELNIIENNLTLVLNIWLLSSFITFLVSFIYIYKLKSSSRLIFETKWCLNAIKLSGYFFISTILFRFVLGADKFIVEHYLGIEIVAVYSLYFSVAFSSVSLVEAGVSSWNYPKLLNIVNRGNNSEIRHFLFSYFIKNMISSTVFIVPIILIFSFLALNNLDAVYSYNLNSFYIICFGVWMFCLSIPFHYYIYAYYNDIVFIYIYLTSFITYLILGVFLLEKWGLFGAAIMIALALSVIGLLRAIYSINKVSKSLST